MTAGGGRSSWRRLPSRLDAPVTVLNVDNEVVTIEETRVSFSGVGRQKPKR